MLISLNLTNIKSGYRLIERADHELRQRWRQPILAAYTSQRSKFDAALNNYKKMKKRRLLILGAGLAFILLLLFTGSILISLPFLTSSQSAWFADTLCFGPILCVSGVGATILLAGFFFYLPQPLKPNPPHPPSEAITQLINPPLVDQWVTGLAGKLPEVHPDEGFSGEVLFIRQLEQLPKKMFILHRLVQKSGDDLDIVLVGEKGVWLFEVKFWKGLIIHENGEWLKSKKYRGRNGDEMIDTRLIEQPPEMQWQRMKRDLTLTLNKKMPSFNRLGKETQTIRGGVVFTHPKSKYIIPKRSGFSWGNVSFWIDQIQKAPNIPYFEDTGNSLAIIEVFLKRHQQVVKSAGTKSMKDFATQLITQADLKISEYCEANSD